MDPEKPKRAFIVSSIPEEYEHDDLMTFLNSWIGKGKFELKNNEELMERRQCRIFILDEKVVKMIEKTGVLDREGKRMAIVEESDEEVAVIIYHPNKESKEEVIAEAILQFLEKYGQLIPKHFHDSILKNMRITYR